MKQGAKNGGGAMAEERKTFCNKLGMQPERLCVANASIAGADADAYEQLCKDIRKCESCPVRSDISSGKVKLEAFDDCKEANLWTYWQGFHWRREKKVKVLLVGQDWGNPNQQHLQRCIANIKAMNGDDSAGVRYYSGCDKESKKNFATDLNLIKLFGYLNLEWGDLWEERHDELFFTNLVPGYRKGSSAGGNPGPFLCAGALRLFARLVDLLEPQVILCLGRFTYEGVLRALDEKPPAKGLTYNEAINGGPTVAHRVGCEIPVFPLAHCGGLGTSNRNRTLTPEDKKTLAEMPKDFEDPKLYLQARDWQEVGRYID